MNQLTDVKTSLSDILNTDTKSNDKSEYNYNLDQSIIYTNKNLSQNQLKLSETPLLNSLDKSFLVIEEKDKEAGDYNLSKHIIGANLENQYNSLILQEIQNVNNEPKFEEKTQSQMVLETYLFENKGNNQDHISLESKDIKSKQNQHIQDKIGSSKIFPDLQNRLNYLNLNIPKDGLKKHNEGNSSNFVISQQNLPVIQKEDINYDSLDRLLLAKSTYIPQKESKLEYRKEEISEKFPINYKKEITKKNLTSQPTDSTSRISSQISNLLSKDLNELANYIPINPKITGDLQSTFHDLEKVMGKDNKVEPRINQDLHSAEGEINSNKIKNEQSHQRRLSNKIQEILKFYPQKEVAMANNFEGQEVVANFLQEKPLHQLLQSSKPENALPTSILLNQSFEEKILTFLSPQKNSNSLSRVMLSKSPLFTQNNFDDFNQYTEEVRNIPEDSMENRVSESDSKRENFESNSFSFEKGNQIQAIDHQIIHKEKRMTLNIPLTENDYEDEQLNPNKPKVNNFINGNSSSTIEDIKSKRMTMNLKLDESVLDGNEQKFDHTLNQDFMNKNRINKYIKQFNPQNRISLGIGVEDDDENMTPPNLPFQFIHPNERNVQEIVKQDTNNQGFKKVVTTGNNQKSKDNKQLLIQKGNSDKEKDKNLILKTKNEQHNINNKKRLYPFEFQAGNTLNNVKLNEKNQKLQGQQKVKKVKLDSNEKELENSLEKQRKINMLLLAPSPLKLFKQDLEIRHPIAPVADDDPKYQSSFPKLQIQNQHSFGSDLEKQTSSAFSSSNVKNLSPKFGKHLENDNIIKNLENPNNLQLDFKKTEHEVIINPNHHIIEKRVSFEEDVGNEIENHTRRSLPMAALICKSPKINKLQKKFLLDFLSPSMQINFLNQKPNMDTYMPSYSKQTLEELEINLPKSEHDEQENQMQDGLNSMNLLKQLLKEKCQRAFGISKRVKALKEQNYDLEHNTQALKQENLKLITEIEKEKEEFYDKSNGRTNLEITSIIFDKNCNAILKNLKLLEAIFGYTIKLTKEINKTQVICSLGILNDFIGDIKLNMVESGNNGKIVVKYTIEDLKLYHKKSELRLDWEIKSNMPIQEHINTFEIKHLMTIMYLQSKKSLAKKTIKDIGQLAGMIAFRISSYMLLIQVLKDIQNKHIVKLMIINYEMNYLKFFIKFRHIPNKEFGFKVNLNKLWWDEIEMVIENHKDDGKENKDTNLKDSKMLERMWENTEKKLKTIFNSEITNTNILKLTTLVHDIDNFKWVV